MLYGNDISNLILRIRSGPIAIDLYFLAAMPRCCFIPFFTYPRQRPLTQSTKFSVDLRSCWKTLSHSDSREVGALDILSTTGLQASKRLRVRWDREWPQAWGWPSQVSGSLRDTTVRIMTFSPSVFPPCVAMVA